MKFEDWTEWDYEMIKSLAKDEYINTKLSNPTACTIKAVLGAIHAMGYNIVKDETREATWSHGPKKSWYAEYIKKW